MGLGHGLQDGGGFPGFEYKFQAPFLDLFPLTHLTQKRLGPVQRLECSSPQNPKAGLAIVPQMPGTCLEQGISKSLGMIGWDVNHQLPKDPLQGLQNSGVPKAQGIGQGPAHRIGHGIRVGMGRIDRKTGFQNTMNKALHPPAVPNPGEWIKKQGVMGDQKIATLFQCFFDEFITDIQPYKDSCQGSIRAAALKSAAIVRLLQTNRKNLVQNPDRFVN